MAPSDPVHRLVIEFRGDPEPVEQLLTKLPLVAAHLDIAVERHYLERAAEPPAT